ncbi:MAG: NUDIX domain-containing protein [Egibacteraceae bacterium]
MRPLTVGVRAIVTNERGEVLLLRHTYKSGFYLPGGKVKRGESLSEAVLRELREEVGVRDVDKSQVALVGAYSSFSSFKSDHILVVSARTSAAARPTSRLEVESVTFADPRHLPEQTSPATRRRIEEYLQNEVSIGVW